MQRSLHDIINEQGNCSDISDDISEKYCFSHVFLLISNLWCLIGPITNDLTPLS